MDFFIQMSRIVLFICHLRLYNFYARIRNLTVFMFANCQFGMLGMINRVSLRLPHGSSAGDNMPLDSLWFIICRKLSSKHPFGYYATCYTYSFMSDISYINGVICVMVSLFSWIFVEVDVLMSSFLNGHYFCTFICYLLTTFYIWSVWFAIEQYDWFTSLQKCFNFFLIRVLNWVICQVNFFVEHFLICSLVFSS